MYNIRLVASMRDLQPDNIIRSRLLPQRRNGIISHNKRIQRIDTQPRTIRSVSRFTAVRCCKVRVGCCADVRAIVDDTGVRDEGDVDVVVGASFEKGDLASRTRLFSRGAEKDELAR